MPKVTNALRYCSNNIIMDGFNAAGIFTDTDTDSAVSIRLHGACHFGTASCPFNANIPACSVFDNIYKLRGMAFFLPVGFGYHVTRQKPHFACRPFLNNLLNFSFHILREYAECPFAQVPELILGNKKVLNGSVPVEPQVYILAHVLDEDIPAHFIPVTYGMPIDRDNFITGKYSVP